MKLDYNSGKEAIQDYSVIYARMNKTAQEDERLGMLQDKVDKESSLAAMKRSLITSPELYHKGGMKKVNDRLEALLGNVAAPSGYLDGTGWMGTGIGADSPGSVFSQSGGIDSVEDAMRLLYKYQDELSAGQEFTAGQFHKIYVKPLRELYEQGMQADAYTKFGIGGSVSKPTPVSAGASTPNTTTEEFKTHIEQTKSSFETPLNDPPVTPQNTVDGKVIQPSSQSEIDAVNNVSQHSNAIQAIGKQLAQLNTVDEVEAFGRQVTDKRQELATPPSKADMAKVQQMFLLRLEEVRSKKPSMFSNASMKAL